MLNVECGMANRREPKHSQFTYWTRTRPGNGMLQLTNKQTNNKVRTNKASSEAYTFYSFSISGECVAQIFIAKMFMAWSTCFLSLSFCIFVCVWLRLRLGVLFVLKWPIFSRFLHIIIFNTRSSFKLCNTSDANGLSYMCLVLWKSNDFRLHYHKYLRIANALEL